MVWFTDSYVVEAAARLAAEVTGGDHLLEQRSRAVLRIIEVVVEHLHHREHHVETDQIAQRERTDRMVAAELHRFVDVGCRRDSLGIGKHRFVEHRAQQPVDDEAGASFTTTAVLPSRFASATAASTVASSVCGPRTTSTRCMAATGLKKCMPTKACGRFACRGQPANRDRRRVGRHDGIVSAPPHRCAAGSQPSAPRSRWRLR